MCGVAVVSRSPAEPPPGPAFDWTGVKPEVSLPAELDENLNGTGIGLSMARQITHDHGGEISLNSCPGSGTEVILALPLAACAGGSR